MDVAFLLHVHSLCITFALIVAFLSGFARTNFSILCDVTKELFHFTKITITMITYTSLQIICISRYFIYLCQNLRMLFYCILFIFKPQILFLLFVEKTESSFPAYFCMLSLIINFQWQKTVTYFTFFIWRYNIAPEKKRINTENK